MKKFLKLLIVGEILLSLGTSAKCSEYVTPTGETYDVIDVRGNGACGFYVLGCERFAACEQLIANMAGQERKKFAYTCKTSDIGSSQCFIEMTLVRLIELKNYRDFNEGTNHYLNEDELALFNYIIHKKNTTVFAAPRNSAMEYIFNATYDNSIIFLNSDNDHFQRLLKPAQNEYEDLGNLLITIALKAAEDDEFGQILFNIDSAICDAQNNMNVEIEFQQLLALSIVELKNHGCIAGFCLENLQDTQKNWLFVNGHGKWSHLGHPNWSHFG